MDPSGKTDVPKETSNTMKKVAESIKNSSNITGLPKQNKVSSSDSSQNFESQVQSKNPQHNPNTLKNDGVALTYQNQASKVLPANVLTSSVVKGSSSTSILGTNLNMAAIPASENPKSDTKNERNVTELTVTENAERHTAKISQGGQKSSRKTNQVTDKTSATTKTTTKSVTRGPVPVFNPISEWEEPVEIPSLTLYDIHRKPRSVNSDPKCRIVVPIKDLTSEFQCPVCLGYMKKTSIVMECLHRFCGDCIQKCLRVGKKECPSCRIHIPSRRSLRPDPNFDLLISKIYGDIKLLEKHEEKMNAEFNKARNMNNAYAESRKRGLLQQASSRKKKQISQNKYNTFNGAVRMTQNSSDMQPTSLTLQNISNYKEVAINADTHNQFLDDEESLLVEFYLKRHPQETLVDRLEREFIRTSKDLKTHQLKNFLSRKLEYYPSAHFQIIAIAQGKGAILNDEITVADLKNEICDLTDTSELVLYYRIMQPH